MALHTDIPTRREIERLLDIAPQHRVSIYLPTHRVTRETAQDRLVLRDLTGRAVELLEGTDADQRSIDAIAEHLHHLVDDDDFWIDQADSLAIFASPDRVETHRLPNHLTASVHVSDRFHLTPLLRTVTFPQAAWVLAISQGGVRLLEIGPTGPPQEAVVPGLPNDAWDASGNRIHRAREVAYARKVDAALRDVIIGSDLPLVLAASQPIAALFREVCTYPHLVPERQHGSPDTTSDADLAQATRAILDDVYAGELADLVQLFDERRSQGRAAFDLSDLARLATLGAVDTVLVDIDQTVPGCIDDAGAVTFADHDDGTSYGVIDEIARRVLLAGGRVLAVRADDIPEGGPAAAILRYSV